MLTIPKFEQSQDTEAISSNVVASSVPRIHRHTVELGDLNFGAYRSDGKTGRREYSLGINGKTVKYTNRFSTSLLGLLGQGASVFDLFEPAEVLQRATERNKLTQVTVTTSEDRKTGAFTALAASKPNKQRVSLNNIYRLVEEGIGGKNGGGAGDQKITGISYADGIVTLRHNPTTSISSFVIGDNKDFEDKVTPQFYTDIPLDGYGNPAVYLGILREVCSNGMVAMAKAFRSSVTLGNGKDDGEGPLTTLSRLFHTFNNEDGYITLRQRIETAANTRCSLNEFYKLYRVVLRAKYAVDDTGDTETYLDPEVNISKVFFNLGGDIMKTYGISSLDAVHEKRRQYLDIPGTSVWDLMNLGTELATHHTDAGTAKKIHAQMGILLAEPYDLEGISISEEDNAALFFDGHVDPEQDSISEVFDALNVDTTAN